MSFDTEDIAAELNDVTQATGYMAMPFKAFRFWDRERELARQRAKYLREVSTPEGIERRRRWARESYCRKMSTPEGRRHIAERALKNRRLRILRRGYP